MGDREYTYLTYEALDGGTIVRIMLNRPRTRNAQNRGLLVELGEAFLRAERDDAVRVVVLGGHGPMFSAGHDMGSAEGRRDTAPGPEQHPSARVNGGTRDGAERLMLPGDDGIVDWRTAPDVPPARPGLVRADPVTR